MKKKKQKITVEIKTRKETIPVIYVNILGIAPYVEKITITYEKPYLEIQIPFKKP